jgi:hypothetical protein
MGIAAAKARAANDRDFLVTATRIGALPRKQDADRLAFGG